MNFSGSADQSPVGSGPSVGIEELREERQRAPRKYP